MVKIGIAGIGGKMGRRIADLAQRDDDVEIASGLEIQDSPLAGTEAYGIKITSDIKEACKNIHCMIDFTLPEGTLEHLKLCYENRVPMVIGTTGIDKEGEEQILKCSGDIPLVFSPNMAIGVNVVFEIVREAARVLGKEFDIKVDETHHVHKKDSPSGTAKRIAEVITEACNKDPVIEAFRKGEVIGNHGIVFDGEYENIEIRHDAKSRDVFARGAIEAAKYIVGKTPGLYTMRDVLGL